MYQIVREEEEAALLLRSRGIFFKITLREMDMVNETIYASVRGK